MIDYWKPVGAFIENTIRPLLDQMKWMFEEMDKRGLKVNEKNIKEITDFVCRCHFKTVLIKAVQAITITGIICATWIISKG
jgi:hypothetical protein